MDKIKEYLENAFNYERDVVYFPVRHHSPSCAYHLEKTIEEYNPDCILIEGPVNATDKIVSLVNNCEMPVALYYTYKDDYSEVSEDAAGKYMCYYPFNKYSPEYIAMKNAVKSNINVEFMDLSYEKILYYSKEGRGVKEKDEKKLYKEEYLFDSNDYINSLIEKEVVRNHDELWEKLFEIKGLNLSTKDFARNLLTYCYLTRAVTSDSEMASDGIFKREEFMAFNIREKRKSYKRILVIAGGFHIKGLLELEDKNELDLVFMKNSAEVYIISYSYEEIDKLNGYASGMSYSNFYSRIYENINKGNTYEKAVLEFISKTLKELRSEKEGISTADGIEAFNMALGLASLRDKENPGVYELIDGVSTAMIKGESSISNSKPVYYLKKLLIGNSVGKVDYASDAPPIIKDFRKRCEEFKVDLKTTSKNTKNLSIYNKEKHKVVSEFFYKLNFLNIDFNILIKGCDFSNKSELKRVIEVWEYSFKARTDASLIESSIYGESIDKAVLEKLKEALLRSKKSSDATKILIDVSLMGVNEYYTRVKENLKKLIFEDNSFVSLSNALKDLSYLYNINSIFKAYEGKFILELMELIFNKINENMYGYLSNILEDDSFNAVAMLKSIYHIYINKEYGLSAYSKEFSKALSECGNVERGVVRGAVRALMFHLGNASETFIIEGFKGFIYGAEFYRDEAMKYLNGVFIIARELILRNDEFLILIDKVIRESTYEDFISCVPHLRLAFSEFMPYEIDEIAKRISKLYNVSSEKIDEEYIDEEISSYGKKIDLKASTLLKAFGRRW